MHQEKVVRSWMKKRNSSYKTI